MLKHTKSLKNLFPGYISFRRSVVKINPMVIGITLPVITVFILLMFAVYCYVITFLFA